jgi:hypothetical protein
MEVSVAGKAHNRSEYSPSMTNWDSCWGRVSGRELAAELFDCNSDGQKMEGLPLKIAEEHDEGFGFWNI